MSLDFDGVNDFVLLDTQTIGTTISIAAWFNADDQGEGDAGTIVQQDDSVGAFRIRFNWNETGASKKLRFNTNRATDGTWEMSSAFADVTGWKGVVVTYDTGSTTNDPILYTLVDSTFSTLTVGSGLTETSTPNGAIAADGEGIRVGCNEAGDRTWNGKIGEFALWTRILPEAEAASVLHNGMLSAPDGLYLYWPMDDTGSAHALDFSGNARNGTISGAVLGANPPVRPCGRRG